ncbi:hypothetical protein [Sphingomonas baiyangensis]|uniref:Terminase small subunit n=1 Tax=Sphingomonas baiyangensis TaxID=2572576 RepID=A0A4U1L5T0_9SPHN|nr:hypothetical protein [Sphingomonas baiyangensis]TKD51663.1 hypothetical protein FBR43_13540 [Sphingomonas baiyangensis]
MDDVLSGGANRTVQRRAARPGWTMRRRKRFLEMLAATCNVRRAAAAAGVAPSGAYALRQRDEVFAALWQEALEAGYDRLEHAVLERALIGVNAIEIEGLVDVEVVAGALPVDATADAVAVERVDIAVALKVLAQHRASVQAGHGVNRSTARATPEETDAAIIKKLDLLAKRLKRERGEG